MELSEVYRSARERLEWDGWWQGSYRGPNGERCLLGALPNYHWYTALDRLTRVVGNTAEWNDHPSRTKEDVILLLKFAEADELATWKELYG
jgi:hypothetical protein